MKSDINKYGQFFTKKEMCSYVLNEVNRIKSIKGSLLEPSFGCGNFIDSLSPYNLNLVDGIEVDKKHFDDFMKTINFYSFKTNLLNIDFLDFVSDKKYDFIIGNPPYIEICYSFYNKERQSKIKKEYKKISNGRINLVHIFMKRSFDMINDDGIIAFLLPSSILTSPTYKNIRKMIYEKFEVETLIEDVSFDDVAIKVSLLIIRKKTNTGKYFYINGDNYFIMNSYSKFENTSTIKDFGFNVSIGEVVWNQKKDMLTSDDTYNKLIYSSNLIKNGLTFSMNNNDNKKQYIKDHLVKYKDCIIFPRTVSKKIKYFYVKDNKDMIFENHILILTNSNKSLLDLFYMNLESGLYDDLLNSFFNSSNLTKGELLSLPFNV